MIVHYRTISLIILVGLATTALLNTLSTKYSREFVAQATSIRLSRATTSSGSAIPQGGTKAPVLSNTSRRTTGDVCKHAERASATRMRYLKLHPPSFATTREMFRPVKRLLFFIGPARSGSTLMGRLLDAHPHITVTNEFDLFTRWPSEPKLWDKKKLFTNLYKESAIAAWLGMKALNQQKYRGCFTAYIRVPYQWQGKCDGYLEVIGDKKAQATLRAIQTNSKIVDEIRSKLGLPMSFIYPLRHPLDMVATHVLRETGKYETYSHTNKQLYNLPKLKSAIHHFNNLTKAIQDWMDSNMLDILPVHNDDLIYDTKRTLETVCGFLNVTCTSDYIGNCGKVIYKESSRTRDNVYWPPDLKQQLLSIVKQYKILARYEKDF